MPQTFADPVAAHAWETARATAAGPRGERPRPVAAWQWIDRLEPWLGAAMQAAARTDPAASSAAEWLLDNGYVVQRALLLVRDDLPGGFYARLRPLTEDREDARGGEPRILFLAHDLLQASHFQLSRESVLAYLAGFQDLQVLDIAELWAFPAMLRLACIERLVAGAAHAFGKVEAPFRPSASCRRFMPAPGDASECVGRAIANLAVVSSIDWKETFDATSCVDRALATDPAATYATCDFETRDACRSAVERLADRAGQDEVAVAQAALALCAGHDALPLTHVGYWLIGPGLARLEETLAIERSARTRLARRLRRHPGAAYAAALFACGIAGLAVPLAYLVWHGAGPLLLLAGLALAALPATVLSVTVVNWLVTLAVRPRPLPKLDFSDGIPAAHAPVVVVPVIVGGVGEVAALIARLEAHRLANPGARGYVLLSDPADAAEKRTGDDDAIEHALASGIAHLSRRHGGGFCLMHRTRRWNAAQGCWMAWERKRGKIEEFNRFLLTGDTAPFPVCAGDTQRLIGAPFVVTADADTRLPPGSVARMAGTLAHPLNRPAFDAAGRVATGYTVLQPRVELAPHGSETAFARLFGGDTAIDIYSRAVSDVYQDLTGTGNFVGKGIYDVAAFARSVEGRVPENLLLSHDLWEGLHGRAALASDIIVYESFPASYAEYVRRWHRWVRGDWQLLPWLLPRVPGPDATRLRNRLSAFDRLRIWDTMRRSLVPPSALALLLAGWFWLPGSPVFWTAMALLVSGAGLFTDLVTGVARGRRRGVRTRARRRAIDHLARWGLQIVFLVSDSAVALHAIGVTLLRLRRGRGLLEWTSAAHVNHQLSRAGPRQAQWRATWTSPATALLAAGGLAFAPHALAAAAPVLLAWLLAPEIAWRTARTPRRPVSVPNAADRRYLRRCARLSWFFFERFAGPEDHWLPPDNHQEAPEAATAHRTSPTNIGMLALSTLSAWRLGHIGTPDLAARMEALLDSLDRLERWHGHILNWYDTRDLSPLEPRYVSTVDSGNLAVSLVVLATGCEVAGRAPGFADRRWAGLEDCLDLLADAVFDARLDGGLAQRIAALRTRLEERPAQDAAHWTELQRDATAQMAQIRQALLRALEHHEDVEPALLQRVNDWLERGEHQLAQGAAELAASPEDRDALARQLGRIGQRARDMAEAMDFRPLYNRHRKLFHIGYDVTAQRIDQHFYDLLASEARLASYFAIAKRDVPPEHWFQLGRPIVKRRRQLSLVSWNGSMFEYLMPSLFLRSDPSTLLGETETASLAIQRHYCDRRGVPWGISESGYASVGGDGVWRYRAFGVPDLGLRRGLEEDLVVAPYASALGLAADAHAAVDNLRRLERAGALGRFGFHEALDFTPGRAPEGRRPAIVRSYMAHHHGMAIAAMANALDDDVMVRWFHADRRMDAVDLLLNERIPWELPPELERAATIAAQQREVALPPRPEPWELVPHGRPVPLLLGNGRLRVQAGSDGRSDLAWKGAAVTCPAGRDRNRGHVFHVREWRDGAGWTLPRAPAGDGTGRLVVHPHRLEWRDRYDGIAATTDILVSPSQDVEIRRVRLVNQTPDERVLECASHADLALAESGEWARHPAFARLFVECESRPDIQTLVFRRRPRDPEGPGLAMAQRFVAPDTGVRMLGYEVSRERTRGRLGDPARFPRIRRRTGPVERFPLDPAAAFLCEVALPPHGEAQFAIVTALAPLESEAVELVRRHGSLASLDWVDQDAADSVRRDLQAIDLPSPRLRDADRLFGAVFAPPGPRPLPENAAGADAPVREDLWGLGLSGDLPILLVELEEEFDAAGVRFLLAAHRLWRWRGAEVDLVLLHAGLPGYVEPLRERILDLVREAGCDDRIGMRGGIAVVGRDHAEPRRIAALRSAAAVTLPDATADALERVLAPADARIPVPAFVATRAADAHRHAAIAPPQAPRLTLANGIGGFTPAGDYRIDLPGGQRTPAPWANVIANAAFGTIATEAGLGFTFALNSGENRLTPWHNDPLLDPQAEALYLRDEETGAIWSVSPLPAGNAGDCAVEHAPGETRWHRTAMGLAQAMTCFVAEDDPVKIVTLSLHNPGPAPRRVTATFFADWLLGIDPAEPAPFRTARYDPQCAAILGRNGWQRDFAGRVAFLAATAPVHSMTTSRSDFLGSPPDWRRPAGLIAWGLGERAGNSGADAVAALQLHLDLPPGARTECAFVLGEAEDRAAVEGLLARWRAPGAIAAGREAVATAWQKRCGALQVTTPDPALDLMVNRWLPYQALSSRLHARAGFYQASGAFGFRDQLQDVLAILLPLPGLARAHILEAAAHQFEEGDVLHWWHPPSGRGVRTRCSDDLLWLPYATARYVEATGDTGILDETVPYLTAAELAPDERDRFGEYPHGGTGSLYDHCLRAFERAWRLGARGLPLMGDGDWNDGMNRIGAAGRGESVWLAWFMASAIRDFAAIGTAAGRPDFADRWTPRRTQLLAAVEAHGWDGAWYARAFDDSGRPWGAARNRECRIDALVQSWAVIAGGDPARAAQAIESAFAELVLAPEHVALLLAPPFHHTPREPGYIKAYPPGVRENGGQYSHAAAWLGIACTMLGDGARAKAVFDCLNPVRHADSGKRAALFRTEPYALAADIAGGAHLGRGGWSWYTGAAGWTWRLATEHILGIRLMGGAIALSPCLPPDWPGFSARVERGGAAIAITVSRTGEAACRIDGKEAAPGRIEFPQPGRCVHVELVLPGHAPAADRASAEAQAGPSGIY